MRRNTIYVNYHLIDNKVF